MLTATKWSDVLVSGEPGILITPRSWQGNPDVTGVIYCHGANGDELEPWRVGVSAETMRNVITNIVNEGIPVLSCYLGGNVWGNSEGITKLDNAANWMWQNVGVKPGKIALLGQSMGHLTAMNWARLRSYQLSCVVSSMGVTDLNDIHGQSSYQASIDAAYPGGASDYNSESFNPIVNAGAKYGHIPWQGWIGDNDTVAKTAKMQQFAALLGDHAELHIATGGHSWGTVGNWDADAITAFIARHTNIE